MSIDEQIANIDRNIKDHEAALAYLNEKRRELVNRGNLNKCVLDHYWTAKGPGPFNVVYRKSGKRDAE